MILGVVVPLSADNPNCAVRIGGMMAVVSGVLCVAADFAKLGFFNKLLSKPIRYGYIAGLP